jgi:hypothetical protein
MNTSCLASLSILLLAGCGGTATVGSFNGPTEAGAPVADGGGTADAPSPPDDAGTPLDSSRPSPDAGQDAPPGEAPIDPLVIGHRWTFEVAEVGAYPACPSGTHEVAVLSAAQRDGKDAFAVQSFCIGLPPLYYAEDGDVVQWDDMGTWVLVLDAPVQEGHAWTNGVQTYVWHDLGSFTVRAGTFEKCFKAQDTGGPSYSILCRGIGPVKMVYRDGSGNGYDAELRAKSF